MTAPGCLGVEGKGKAPRWRLTELPTEDSPTRDFLRWNGVKFRDQKKQNPGPEKGTTVVPKRGPLVVPKRGPPEAKSGPEKGTKANGKSGPEKGTKIILTIPSPVQSEPDAPGMVQLRQRVAEADQVDDSRRGDHQEEQAMSKEIRTASSAEA